MIFPLIILQKLVKMSICATRSLPRSYRIISDSQRHKWLVWCSVQSRISTTWHRYTVILHRSVYFTTDRSQKPFTHDNQLRLRLKLTVPVFPVSLPYTGCLTMPISRHFRHFIRATHACCLHNLHMVLTEIPWKITDNSRCGNRTHDSCLMRAEPYHLANPQYCS